jgi:hypothetical protein
VTLTAPSTAGGNNFSSWTGCDSATATTCNVTMSANKTVTAAYVAPVSNPTITLSYDGKVADRVGQGESSQNPDGQLDGVFTVVLNAGSGNRTVTRLQLTNGSRLWNTQPSDLYWTLGAAPTVNGALYNAANDSVNFTVLDGGSFKIFGSDYRGGGFLSGNVLTVTVNFSDGTSAVGSVTIP